MPLERITADEAAKELGISRVDIEEFVETGEIPAEKVWVVDLEGDDDPQL